MQDFAAQSLDVLARDECLTLLATTPIGRIVFTERALPAVRLVNFVLHDDQIIIRTGEGNKLLSAVGRAVVAFEADEVDHHTHTGWSVTVIGHARQVTDPAELAALRELVPASWAPGGRDHVICIEVELVSGRRLALARGGASRQCPLRGATPPEPPGGGLRPHTGNGRPHSELY